MGLGGGAVCEGLGEACGDQCVCRGGYRGLWGPCEGLWGACEGLGGGEGVAEGPGAACEGPRRCVRGSGWGGGAQLRGAPAAFPQPFRPYPSGTATHPGLGFSLRSLPQQPPARGSPGAIPPPPHSPPKPGPGGAVLGPARLRAA